MIIPLLQLLHLLYLWVLEFIPNPEFFIYPYLASSGWLPYRQIIDQHFPGLWLLPVNFATFGFTDPAAFKILLLLTVLAQSAMVYYLARRLFAVRTAVFAVLFYAVWQPFFAGSNLWIDLFLPLFTLPAFFFTVRKNWLLSGLFLGLGLLFKQNLVLLIFIPGYYIFRSGTFWRSCLDFVFGLILPWIPVIIFLQIHRLVPDFFAWTVIFNLTVYRDLSGLAPGWTDIFRLSLPLLLAVAVWLKPGHGQRYGRLFLVWGLLSVITGFSRYNLYHFQPAVPFFCLALGLLADSLSVRLKSMLIIGSLVWSLGLTLRHQHFLQTAYFDTVDSALVGAVRQLTRPGDTVFVLGGQPLLYSQTGTYPPGKLFSFPLPWYLKQLEAATVFSLLKDPPVLIVYNPESSVDGKNIVSYAPLLVKYVTAKYHPVKQIGPNVIYLLYK